MLNVMKVIGLRPLVRSLFIGALLLVCLQTQAADSHQSRQIDKLLFDAKQAFTREDFTTALNLYQALDQIDSSYGSRYNLGVCHYKLGQFPQAYAVFSELHQQEPDHDWVHLNLAITEVKLGDYDMAKLRLLAVAISAESDAVAGLAYRNYQRLLEAYPELNSVDGNLDANPWSLNGGISYGSDDNVVSIIDGTANIISDNYMEGDFSAAWYSSEDRNQAWRLEVDAYTSTYDTVSDYDLDVIHVGVKKYFSLSRQQRAHWGLRVSQSAVGGESYLRVLETGFGSRYRLNRSTKLKYDIRYQHSVEESSRFQAFAGQSLRLRSGLYKTIDRQRWVLRYQFDIDDKNDEAGSATIAGNSTFTSYSPKQHGIYASWSYYKGIWRARIKAEHRKGEYQDPHVSIDDTSVTRKDNRTTLGLSLKRKFGKHWSLKAALRQLDNRSNLGQYDYGQQLVSLRLDWQN